jgi:hypothetical protein
MRALFISTVLFGSIVSSMALAIQPSQVKITSFRYLTPAGGPRSAGAELCGETLVKTNQNQMIKIVSDPKSDGPGIYYAWTGKEGKFCTVIATYSGLAEADLAD